MSEEHTAPAETEERSVTPFELFFDLVFVFAFTQVTAFLAKDPTLETFAKGLLILAALWWAWGAYAWLGSSLHLEEGATRVVMCVVMGALLIVGLAEPHAFDSDAWIFGIAYFVVRALHIALYLVAARVSTDLLGAVLNLSKTALPAATLILISAAFPEEMRPWIWLVALAIDFLGPLLLANDGWQIAVEHFVERHRLILIIALGESIVAVGIGAEAAELTLPVILAALLAITLTVTIWWTYFDIASAVSEHVLARAGAGPAQMHMARDGFSYLHYPMIAGITR